MKFLGKMWAWFTKPSRRAGAGVLVAAGILGGVFLTAGFNWSVEYTNSTEFCMSCHSLKPAVEEWQESHHYSNPSGIRAECKDCHVADAFWPKMGDKVAAYNDVLHELLGTIDTREKFEERRPVLSERVWERMRRTDSRECRSCHEWNQMAMADQAPRARREHEQGLEDGDACIDCHKGVAHKYPKEEEEFDMDFGF